MKLQKGLVCAALSTSLLWACSKTPPPDPDGPGTEGAVGSGGSAGQPAGTGGATGGGGSGATGGSSQPAGGSGGAPGTGGVVGGPTGGTRGGTGGSTPDSGAGGEGKSDASADVGSTLPPNVLGHPDPATEYPQYPGFTLALVEEFATPLNLDTDPVWTWSDGGLPEGDVRFVKDAITFENGKMILSASQRAQNAGAAFAEPSPGVPMGPVGRKGLSSGEVRTKFNNFRYGLYEVRLKPPTSGGNFISTMFVFRTPKFEQWREIDIELTADRPRGVFTNLIFGNNELAWRPQIQEDAGNFPTGAGAMPLPAGFASQGAFHTYAFEWLPGQITWFVDGVPIRVKKGGGLGVPELSAKIIINLWVFAGNGFGGPNPNDNAYPLRAEYEWFRFYKWNDEKVYPCAATPGCLPGDDRNLSKNNPQDGLTP